MLTQKQGHRPSPCQADSSVARWLRTQGSKKKEVPLSTSPEDLKPFGLMVRLPTLAGGAVRPHGALTAWRQPWTQLCWLIDCLVTTASQPLPARPCSSTNTEAAASSCHLRICSCGLACQLTEQGRPARVPQPSPVPYIPMRTLLQVNDIISTPLALTATVIGVK